MIKSILGGKSKNLFQSSDEVGVLNGGLGPNVARNFEENKWYIGLTSNNYYIPSNIKEYSIKDNLIYFKRDSVDSNGYGLARAIKCEPSFIYTLSFEPIYGAEYYAINIGYFDKDGNLISTNDIAGNSKTITTPNNCNWLVLVFNFYDIYSSGKGELYFGYIQLEIGSTATEYVPHELTSYKSIMKVSDVCQLLPISDKADNVINGVTFTNNHDGGWVVSGTNATTNSVYSLFLNVPLRKGHIYLKGTFVLDSTYTEIKFKNKDNVVQWGRNIYTADENSKCDISLLRAKGATSDVILKPQLFDLTEMFGAGNEPKTVAEFKAKFPNDYYPYSPSCFVTSFDERMPCKTKNLFSSSTEVGIPSSTKFDRSEKRLMEDGKWYIGLAGSNYYSRKDVLDYSIMENSVYIECRGNGYGVAKCIYCEPSTTYSFTNKYSLIQGHSLGIKVGFYTEDGTFISFKGVTASPHFVFTTPENCKYIAICLSGTRFPEDKFSAGCFSDLQLVKGTTATDYVPYGYV